MLPSLSGSEGSGFEMPAGHRGGGRVCDCEWRGPERRGQASLGGGGVVMTEGE